MLGRHIGGVGLALSLLLACGGKKAEQALGNVDDAPRKDAGRGDQDEKPDASSPSHDSDAGLDAGGPTPSAPSTTAPVTTAPVTTATTSPHPTGSPPAQPTTTPAPTVTSVVPSSSVPPSMPMPAVELVDIPIPDGCEGTSYAVAGGFRCSVDFSCEDGAVVSTQCYSNTDTQWDCECAGPGGSDRALFDGVGQVSSCEIASKLCKEDAFVAPTFDACEVTSGNSDQRSCYTEFRCGESIDVADGVSMSKERTEYIQCTALSDPAVPGEDWQCGCGNDPHMYVLRMPSPAAPLDACDDLQQVCVGLESIVAIGLPECTTLSASFEPSACYQTSECLIPARIGDVSTTLDVEVVTGCYSGGTDGWYCESSSVNAPGATNTSPSGTSSLDYCQSGTLAYAESILSVAPEPEPEPEPEPVDAGAVSVP